MGKMNPGFAAYLAKKKGMATAAGSQSPVSTSAKTKPGTMSGGRMMKTKPQGKGIVKALGQKGTTGNFKKIEKAKGKGAAIAALQNKLAKKKGKKAPYNFAKAEKKLGVTY